MTNRTPPNPRLETHEVEPDRLARGAWSHERNRTVGEGDIARSYSADRIGMGQPIRPPFTYDGVLWLCVGLVHGPTVAAWAYRLVHPDFFDGTPTTYAAKAGLDGGGAARADPLGFYHGMTVQRGRETLVLCGPPAEFVTGERWQRSLFE